MGLASPFHYLFCTAPAQTDLDGALPCFDRSFCKKSDLNVAVSKFYYSFCKKSDLDVAVSKFYFSFC